MIRLYHCNKTQQVILSRDKEILASIADSTSKEEKVRFWQDMFQQFFTL